MKKILGIFDKRPLIWFHYILLIMILFASYYSGAYLININETKWYIMFTWFFIWVSIGDQLIHNFLGVD